MKREMTNILEEACCAPSVLNSQPWSFRVCGNTIEVYLDKYSELASIDPHGRLQLASCGTLIAHLKNAIRKRGWAFKAKYFPRFEEENLVAYVEVVDRINHKDQNRSVAEENTPVCSIPGSIQDVQKEIILHAAQGDVGLLVHDDHPDGAVERYFIENCGEKIKSEEFRKNLNMLLRSDTEEVATHFEDEVMLSDHFFDLDETLFHQLKWPDVFRNRYLILVTGTDNRYEWTRAGEVLGNIMIQLKKWDTVGLMALPIITDECCRKWLKSELEIPEFPQFVLKMHPVKPRTHTRKRPFKEMLKYGF